MCGFVGIISKDFKNLFPVFDMTSVINHRGPDDEGFSAFSFSSSTVESIDRCNKSKLPSNAQGIFGFKRLSIQDLSIAGHQPMISRDGKVTIMFNGEIYNTRYLIKILELEGVRLNGGSDTEVLLQLYTVFGIDKTLSLIDGMFSIAILDLAEKKVILIRDHLGIKPLYIYESNGLLIFSSEVKSIRAHPLFYFDINLSNLSEFFLFRDVSSGETLYNNIREVRAGYYEVFNFNNSLHSKKNIIRHYILPKHTKVNCEGVVLANLLDKSISLQLASDVPVGCQLSGGVDSSLITYFASNHLNELGSHSVVVEGEGCSEERFIDQFKSVVDIKNYKYRHNNNYFVDNFIDSIYHLDHPLTHPNSVGIYLLAQNASSDIKVILSGEGADELFAGYTRIFKSLYGFESVNRIFRQLSRMQSNPLSKIFRKFGTHEDRKLSYILNFASPNTPIINSILPDFSFNSAVHNRLKLFDESESSDFLEQVLDYELHAYLPALLKRQDKMTMAFSMENRVPFLGKEFISDIRGSYTSKSLVKSNSFLFGDGVISHGTKIPLKKLSSSIFGKEFTYRKKQGFGFPLVEIMNHPKFNELFHDQCLPKIKDQSILDIHSCESLWSQRNKYPHEAFTLLSYSTWLSIVS